MSFTNAIKRKTQLPETTIQLMNSGKVTRHEAAIAGLSDLSCNQIVKHLHFHPLWVPQVLYCKLLKCFLKKPGYLKPQN